MSESKGRDPTDSTKLKIYLLPNLMTAGNLFCGFLALTKIVEADIEGDFNKNIEQALFYILLACIFDFLDGRVARMSGGESSFGREFDSLADIISFGVAPAFLVHRVVLKDVFEVNWPELGWFISSLFLICGAFRLARFNCLSAASEKDDNKEFLGFPIPAAAGLVASLTLFIMWGEKQAFSEGKWRYALPVIMGFLSVMMVSRVRYPTFKKVNWRARRPFTMMLVFILMVGSIFFLRKIILPIVAPLFFTAYLIYGFIRPRIPRRVIQKIEEDEEDD